MFVIFAAAVFFAVQPCAAQVQYVVTDLGTLGGNYSYARGINDNGQIVGTATISNISSDCHAFLYSNGTMSDIGAFQDFYSFAVSINNNGQIAGYVSNPSPPSWKYDMAFYYANGSMTIIGDPTEYYRIGSYGSVHPCGINDQGEVAINGGNLYCDGIITKLPVGVIMRDGSTDINNNGTVVLGPHFDMTGDYNIHYKMYIYSNGICADLGTLPGYSDYNFCCPVAINDNDQVVGYVHDKQNSSYCHPFLYANGEMQELQRFGGVGAIPRDINNNGQIVGSVQYGSGRAFLYNNGAMQDLNSLVEPSSGWTLNSANAINSTGQIVGNGTNPAGKSRAFLLTPVGKCQEYQVQPPTCAPIEHLAKWDGTNWVPVCTGDLSSGNIHILVHGWAPGLRTFADDGGKIWDTTDPKTGSATNADFAGILKNAAIDIKAVAPGDIVVAFNWIDMSATVRSPSDILSLTEARQSRLKTDEAAGDLVDALKSAGIFSGSFTGKLQIFGISHGARVSALATEKLYNSGNVGSVVVNQLTLADSPEGTTGLTGAGNQLGSVLSGIKIGRDASSTFVDNYYSCFGNSYNVDDGIVNVKLTPKPSLSFGDKHVYPVNWYEGASMSINNLGIAWSPLEGDAYKNLSSSYEQDWQNPNGSFDNSKEYNLKDTGAKLSPVEKWLRLDMSTLLTQGLVTAIPSGMRLTEHSPAYWHSSFVKGIDDTAIEFTYQFLNAGDGDQLTLWVDDELRFVITGDLAGTDAFTTDIDISDLDAGYHILSVALNNYGDVNASVDVTDFTMVSVPEPSSLLLLTMGLFFAGKRK